MSIHDEVEQFRAIAQKISDQGAVCKIEVEEQILSVTGASVNISLIPAGALALGVVGRTLSSITGCTSFHLGDQSDADRWGSSLSNLNAQQFGSTGFTAGNPVHSSTNVVVKATAVGSNFTSGRIRLSAFFVRLTGPTS